MANSPADPLGEDFPLLGRARQSWSGGQWDQALDLFEKAVLAHPNHPRALIEAARAFGQRHEIRKAEAYLKRATLAATAPGVLALIAQSYRMIHRPDRAIAAFTALRQAGANRSPNLLFELAVLLERTDRAEEARQAIHECLALAPGYLEPHVLLARLERRLGETEQAARRLHDLENRADLDPVFRAQVLAELAESRDREGDFEGAWAAIEGCKALLRQQAEALRLSQLSVINNEILRRLYSDLDAATLRRWATEPLPRDMRVSGLGHLLGFPRSGTTLLEQVLDAHPGLVSSPERVIFSRDIFMSMYRVRGDEPLTLASLDAIPRERLVGHRRRYLDAMEETLGEPLGGRFHLDKNPNHTSLMVGLHRLLPESKFLVALRDPRDVVVSCYLRWLPLSEFSAGFLTPGSTCNLYAFELSVWLAMKRLLPGGWMEVRYEDTVADLPAQARRVLAFLDLPWDEAVLGYRERLATRRVNSPTHEAVRKPVQAGAIGRWRHYERHLGPYFERLKPFLDAFGYS